MYDYNYLDSMGFMGLLMGFMGGILIIFAIIELAILALTIVGRWKVFEKARQPGWAGIVPFYSELAADFSIGCFLSLILLCPALPPINCPRLLAKGLDSRLALHF